MKNCVIVSAARTAIGSFNGALATTSAIDLGATVIKAALERAQLDPQRVDEVIMGNVLQAGLGQNPARQALLKSGLAETVCGFTVNKVCGSGLKSVALAAQAIQAGQAGDCRRRYGKYEPGAVSAGCQSPLGLSPWRRTALRCDPARRSDLRHSRLPYGDHGRKRRSGIRHQPEMQDELALLSQRKAVAAIDSGASEAEIVPVSVTSRKKTVVFERDELPKADSTAEGLAALRPAFDKAGTVTAGNASGINDARQRLVVMEESCSAGGGPDPTGSYQSHAMPRR